MTRSVTIVNTSNWENEDYIILTKRVSDGVEVDHIVKPGESFEWTPMYNSDIELAEYGEKDAVPFYNNQVDYSTGVPLLSKKQVFPTVIVEFE